MDLSPLEKARTLLTECTPLAINCGELCNAACCQSPEDDQDETGMLLFPGEEALYDPEDSDWMRIVPSKAMHRGKPVPLLICHAPCPRHKRPLSCRIFPLAPRFSRRGLTLRMDARGTSLCPLIDSGVQGLSPQFTAAVTDAFTLLTQDPDQNEFLQTIAHQVKEYERMLRMFVRRQRI